MSVSSREAFRMSRSGQKAISNVREWLGVPPGGPEVVERPSRISVSGRKAIPIIREWLGGLPGYPGVVG